MTAPAAKKSVEFFYDVVSPYTWIAFEVLSRYQNKWNINLELKPFFLGGIMNGSGNRPPGMVPNKALYMDKDLKRLAKYYNIPINAPENPPEVMFVKGSLNAQRLLTATKEEAPEFTGPLSRALWMRIWSRDEDITMPESFKQAGKAAGLTEEQIDTLLKLSKDQKIKDKLKNVTQEALDLGAFGSPFIVTRINNKAEIIFGSDRFPILAQILGEEWQGPLTEMAPLYSKL